MENKLKTPFDDMKSFKGYVSVYVPSTTDLDRKMSKNEHDSLARNVAYELSKIAGGATSTPVKGGYVSNDKSYVEEDITMVRSNYSESCEYELKCKAYEVAQTLKTLYKQEFISVEIDGKLFLV